MVKRFLLRHLGNMGDIVFLLPPVLAALKKNYPGCHITLVTTWGYKERRLTGAVNKLVGHVLPATAESSSDYIWGKRNNGGHSLHLMMTNPHIDELVHWHDYDTDLRGNICREDGRSFSTWSREYYERQKDSGRFDGIFAMDFGLTIHEDPLQHAFEATGCPADSITNYQLYFTDQDLAVAAAVMQSYPRPRIVFLEGLSGQTTRGWDPAKLPHLAAAIKKKYGIPPIYFGSVHVPYYHGRPLTLRENIATLRFGDIGIGVMSGPLHFAAAASLPTLTLYCDAPLRRTAPAYFLNEYVADLKKRHRTLLGPSPANARLLKPASVCQNLTPAEIRRQKFHNWTQPGRQEAKSCVAAITVDEIVDALADMLA